MSENVKFVIPTTKDSDTYYLSSPVGPLEVRGNEEALFSLGRVEAVPDRIPQDHPKWMQHVQSALEAYFSGEKSTFDLAVAPEGTDFQRRVWEALTLIPYGKTCSDLELSRKLGDEKAIRAVGRANGKNPIAILIPCHRVIGSDGSLTGYAGGLAMKKHLLDLEARMSGHFQMALNF